MSFDDAKWASKTNQGTSGLIAINVVVALDAIEEALEKIARKAGVDITDELSEIARMRAALNAMFENLTGWKEG
jgi:xanthine dehydrogenase iron-sulfur cluster and FAD-binding subunit A